MLKLNYSVKSLLLSLFFIFLILLLPSYVHAASCASQGGTCTSTYNLGHVILDYNCATGDPIPSDDCSNVAFVCCPTTPTFLCTVHGSQGIKTAIGCIPYESKPLIDLIATWATGLASGVALLSLFYGGFMLTTSAGDVKKVKSAQNIFVTSIAGLILIFLAILILNFVGVRIFGLDYFGFNV